MIGGSPTGTDLALGAAAGVAGAFGLVLFYWAMSQGPMSVVAPVSAVMSALVPVTTGVLTGDRPSPLAILGIAIALPAIVAISREPSATEAATTEAAVESSLHLHPPGWLTSLGGPPVIAAAVGGIGFGLFFTILAGTSDDSGLWPIASARSTAVVLALLAVALTRTRPSGAAAAAGVRLAMLAGTLDVTANVFYLLASREGLLSLVGVIGAMYPASTVLLARLVLGERLARHQLIGMGVAALAVGLIAAA